MTMFKRMFKKFLGFEEETSEELEYNENPKVNNNDKRQDLTRINNLKNLYTDDTKSETKKAKEIVLYPKTFGDACEVVEHIEQGFTVIVNMDDVDIDTCKRISDFVLGAIYVLQGDVEKISKKVFRFWMPQ